MPARRNRGIGQAARIDGGTVSNQQQLAKMGSASGFIAALDQSGGSTPKALGLYGVGPDAWSDDNEMFDIVHAMRTRIVTSASFTGERILGAILFENTMDRDVAGQPSPSYLWEVKNVVPILKVDKGLAAEEDGVQVMKPMSELEALLARGKAKGIFGTKMRSVIKQASSAGIARVVQQQFDTGNRILNAGLVPIIEPEVDIHCPDKAAAEDILHEEIVKGLDRLADGRRVMLKLTLPEQDNLYSDCVAHANVLRVAALSGGYSREEANARLARQNGMVASFSRALTEGLGVNQSDVEFDALLDRSVQSIFDASGT